MDYSVCQEQHALWLASSSQPMTPMRIVFGRDAVDQMTEYPFLALHDVSIHPPVWDQNFDVLVFYIMEPSWIWLLLKWPELAGLRWGSSQ